MKEIISKINFAIIIITLIILAISSVLITYDKLDLLKYSYVLIGIGIFSICLYAINKKLDFTFSKLEIAIFILIVLTLLSLIGTIDYETALWGRSYRHEGLFVILSYYSIALLASNIKNKNQIKTILFIILFIGLTNIIYGLMQTGWINQNIIDVKNKKFYASGFNSLTMFYGALLSICYPIILGLFIKEKKILNSIIYGILLAVFTLGAIMSGAMAVLLSIATLFCFIIIKNIILLIKNKSKEYLIELIKIVLSGLMLISFIVIIKNNSFYLRNDLKEVKNQMEHIITTKKAKDNFGTSRIYIWKNTISKIKDNFWFGVGIANFKNAFNIPLMELKEDGSIYFISEAHNEYLQIMLCEGFFTGIYYLIFLLAIGIKNIKANDKLYYTLLLAFSCYSIQAFFNVSVTRISPIFFIVVGLLIGNTNDTHQKK